MNNHITFIIYILLAILALVIPQKFGLYIAKRTYGFEPTKASISKATKHFIYLAFLLSGVFTIFWVSLMMYLTSLGLPYYVSQLLLVIAYLLFSLIYFLIVPVWLDGKIRQAFPLK
jgi:hypothetical protein